MKISINLLPPEPGTEALKKKKNRILKASGLLLVVFLLVNLGIFGFYWFLTKNTADTLAAIKREEEIITTIAPTERLYRALDAKLSFLSSLWQKKITAEEVVDFTQTLLVPKVTLTKISLKQDGLTTLSLNVPDSEVLENFLNGVAEKEKSGVIKNIKVISTDKNKDGGYDISVNYEFLGTR
ncbi:hypothetical protein HY946_00605 [Candidatus Gottesmanbacteria bacterium]|nr:hypothetical protein [Candidatus Gottesmanbacteria bacterium]